MWQVRVRRGWARSLAIGAALLLAAVGLVGCTSGPVVTAKDFSAYLPAHVTAASGASSYDIHVWSKPYAAWNAASSWNGELRFTPLDPASTPVIDAQLKSGGSLPFGPFGVLDLGDQAQAKVIADSKGRALGYHLVSPQHYGVVLDLDGDGVADIVDAVTFAPFHRIYAENSTGKKFIAGLGTATCAGAGPSGWDPSVTSLASCRSKTPSKTPKAAGDAAASRFSLAGSVLPADAGPLDIPDIATGIYDASQSAQGPSAADGSQLAADLENYGAGVLVGAYTNDALGEQLGNTGSTGAGWIGQGIQAHGGSAGDVARQFGRGSDDIVTQATALLNTLTPGETPDGTHATDWAASGGCDLAAACRSGGSRGDPHLTTFGGFDYDVQREGEFVLASWPDAGIAVQARFAPLHTSRTVSFTTAVAVVSPDVKIALKATRGGITVTADGAPVTASTTFGSTTVEVQTGGIVITVGSTLEVQAAGGDSVETIVSTTDAASAQGLLSAPDVATATGAGWVDHWKLTDVESALPYGPGETTATYTDATFPQSSVSLDDLDPAASAAALAACRDAGVGAGELDGCVFDVAATGDFDQVRWWGSPTDPAAAPLTFTPYESDAAIPVVGYADRVIDGGPSGDLDHVVGPPDTVDVRLGDSTEVCGAFVDVHLSTPLIDGPGPDLGVQLQVLGGEYYQVYLPKGSGFKKAFDGYWNEAFDLRGILAPGTSVDTLRICTPPLGGTGTGAGGPDLDAVLVLGVR
ncbi:MAG TPA: VWD domain-containing protein [Pseudolysinimonas sp.]|jgi:hypothetical protein